MSVGWAGETDPALYLLSDPHPLLNWQIPGFIGVDELCDMGEEGRTGLDLVSAGHVSDPRGPRTTTGSEGRGVLRPGREQALRR